MIVTYSIDSNDQYFVNFIHSVLNSKKGITSILFDDKIKLKFIDGNANINFKIVSNDTVKNICGFDQLSCADRSDGNIYINKDRWNEGSKVFFNSLGNISYQKKLELYRIYLINHEAMHILGFNHPDKSRRFKGKSSVMAQQTIDLQGGKPYSWPQKKDKEFFVRYYPSLFKK